MGAIVAAVAIMVVTLVAAVATGGAALTNPFFWAFAGEISGAIGGATAAAIRGSDVGGGMLTGAVVGGVTGFAFGAAGGATSEAVSPSIYVVQGAGDVVTRTILADLGSTFIPAIGNIAAQSVITSGVGAGSAVINGMVSNVYAAEQTSTTSNSEVRVTKGYRGYHAGIQIEGAGQYNGRWGYNPDFNSNQFSWGKVLSGQDVPGKIYDQNTGEKPYWFKVTASKDMNYARNLYRSIQVDMAKGNHNYNLYAGDCYQWRNAEFTEADALTKSVHGK